jgi:ABC-type uncharacterized transport system ATPase subunit
LTGIVKRFGAVRALDHVDFDVGHGELHALLGENGAGKTTLMNVASGLLRPESGEIRIAGTRVALRSPRDGYRAGVGMVHQNYRLVPKLSVAENIFLGWEKAPKIATTRDLERRTAELAEHFHLPVDPGVLVQQLSIGERQRVAIVRTLGRGAKTLALDEPTAALTPSEMTQLFEILRNLVADGHSVVFITHKLREVMEVADRVSVLRGGLRVATMPIGEATIGGLARLMVGEMRDMLFPTIEPTRKDDQQTAIAASALSARDDRGHLALDDVSLELRYGEILGVAGVSGNGQRELSEVMTGLRTPSGGTVKVRDAELAGRAPARFIEMGVGHVPEDPKTGLAFGEALTVNAALKSFDDPSMARGPWLVWSRIRRFARRVLELAGLGALTSDRMVATLSGGQAQRLLVYREIDASRGVLVVAHPTRGLDVAATQAVHEALLAAKRRDVGVLLISEDLDEVMALSDRLIVLYEGRLMATRAREEFHREEIGALMGGVHAERESTST